MDEDGDAATHSECEYSPRDGAGCSTDSGVPEPGPADRQAQPGVGLGLTMIASALVLFLSVARPESQRAPDVVVWEVDEALSLRATAGAALLPHFFSATGWPRAGHRDVWEDEEIWSSIDMASIAVPPRATHESASGAASSSHSAATGSKRNDADAHDSLAEQARPPLDPLQGSRASKSDAPSPLPSAPPQPECVWDDSADKRKDRHGQTGQQRRGKIGVNVSLIPGTGWGHLGYEIFFGLYRDLDGLGLAPLLLGDIHPAAHHATTPYSADLVEVLRRQAGERDALMRGASAAHAAGTPGGVRLGFPILHAVDHVYFHRPRAMGSPNVALIFFDDTSHIGARQLRAAEESFDAVVVGSTWNAEVLRDRGLRIPIHTVLQGVDPLLFRPRHPSAPPLATPPPPRAPLGGAAPERRRVLGVDVARGREGAGKVVERPAALGGRFVVFSGGKFELRKAQDIVVGAFRDLVARVDSQQRDAEAGEAALRRPLLLYAWQNPWPIRWYAEGGGPGHTHGVPAAKSGGGAAGGGHEGGAAGAADAGQAGNGYDFATWLESNGVARADALDLGHLDPRDLAVVLRSWVDVALFPNRCEGGTNLVAMEVLASGVPVVLSANTGHLDLVQRACPLSVDGPVGADRPSSSSSSPAGASGVAGCIPLRKQRKIISGGGGASNPYHGWGESDVSEAADALLRVASNATRAAAMGSAGAEAMRSLTWSHTRRQLAALFAS